MGEQQCRQDLAGLLATCQRRQQKPLWERACSRRGSFSRHLCSL